MLTRLVAMLTLTSLLLSSSQAAAWGYHYLITDQALSHPSVSEIAKEEVAVEPLETFLAADPQGLSAVFADYYKWLETKGSKRFKAVTFDATNPSKEAFLHAARLNPAAMLPLVERLLPGASTAAEKLPLENVSQYLKANPAFVIDFIDRTGQTMTARAVMSTFVDEPDWGFDHTLWGFAEYGYGKQPYGKPEGESSKAPFHMLFQNENFLVRSFAPQVLEGMVIDRVELFLRLSRFAFSQNHPYWGYRFASWSIHYLQDLCQPYHSKALPSAGFFYYLHYVFSFRKARLQERVTQLVANRHFLYEDFVALRLQDFYQNPNDTATKLAGFLSTGEADFSVTDTTTLIRTLGKTASKHSPKIDKAIVKAFGKKLTKDPEYNLEKDTSYQVAPTMDAILPKYQDYLLSETQKDFAQTARATRTLLRLVKEK